MPSDKEKARLMQEDVDKQTLPDFKARIINILNKGFAETQQSSVVLRLPQPSPVGDYHIVDFVWTKEQSARYLANGTLPCTLADVDPTKHGMLLWIFDAAGCGDKLPALKLDPVPDFAKHPALCVFDIGGRDDVALIPSSLLRMVPVEGGKVQFVLVNEPFFVDVPTVAEVLAQTRGGG